jgi:hypothetical protein
LPHVPQDLRDFFDPNVEVHFEANRYLNRQFTVLLNDDVPTDAAVVLARKCSAIVKDRGLVLQGRTGKLYFSDDKPWAKNRLHALLKRAELSVLQHAPPDARIKTHWPSGSLFLEQGDASTLLGKVDIAGETWIWEPNFGRFFAIPQPHIAIS